MKILIKVLLLVAFIASTVARPCSDKCGSKDDIEIRINKVKEKLTKMLNNLTNPQSIGILTIPLTKPNTTVGVGGEILGSTFGFGGSNSYVNAGSSSFGGGFGGYPGYGGGFGGSSSYADAGSFGGGWGK
jgi:hypothetical protein